MVVQLPQRLSEARIAQLLETWPVARLATVGVDGRPHQVPVVFAQCEGVLWSPVDGKPKRAGELARSTHVRREPRVSLLLDEYTEDWSRLWWLRVDGEASVVAPNDPAEVAAVAAELRRKYPQYQTTAVLREPPVLLRIVPVKIASWCAAPGPT